MRWVKSQPNTGWKRVAEIKYLLFLTAGYHRQLVHDVAESEAFKTLYARAAAGEFAEFAHNKPAITVKPHQQRTLELRSELFLLELKLGRNLIEHCRNERWQTIRNRIKFHIRKKESKS